MRSWLLGLAALACVSGAARAQVPVFTTSTQTYAPLTGGVNVSLTDTDEGFAVLPLPFAFPWFGQLYSSVFVHTDGVLVLGGAPASCGTATSGYCALYSAPTKVPSSTAPNNIIAPFFADLELAPGGAIRYTSSPSEFTIEFSQLQEWLFGDFGYSATVTLSASGQVLVHYGPTWDDSGSGADAYGAAGFESPDGLTGASFLGVNGTGTCTSLDQSGCCSKTSAVCGIGDIVPNRLITIGEPTEADLAVPSVTISNLVVGGGGNLTFNLEAQLRNYGKTPASGFLWRAFLSSDKVLDASDQQVAQGGPLNLAATSMTTVTAAAATTTPPGTGAYYVLVQVDPTNVVVEATEANNVGWTTESIVRGLDLVAQSITGVASSGGGNVDPITVKFVNRGTDAPGAVNFRILLSTDAVVSQDDFEIFSGTRSLSGGQTIQETLNVTMPMASPNGDFRYLLQVDPGGQLAETDETNNTVASVGTVQVRRADLIAKSAALLDVATELPIEAVRFGEDVKGRFVISNEGGADARNFEVALVVSGDANLSLLSDTIVCETPVVLVAPGGQAQTVDFTCTLPEASAAGAAFATGQYFFFFVADSAGQIYESNKGNNSVMVGPVSATAPGPDLMVGALTAPAVAGVGEVVPVERTLRNAGNRDAAEAAYRYFISANEIITDEDIPLEIVSGTSAVAEGAVTLAAGDADAATELVRLPATMPAGTYYIGCLIDPLGVVADLDRTNNALASRPVLVAPSSLTIATGQLPDATVGRAYLTRLAAAGARGASSQWHFVGAAPEWLSLDGADGTLSGTPSGVGGAPVVAFTVELENDGRRAQRTFALRVLPPSTQVEVTTGALPAVVNGGSVEYVFHLGAAGGVLPYTWRVVAGTLPTGLTLSADGLLSGTPRNAVNGEALVSFEVADSSGGRAVKELPVRVVSSGALVFRTLVVADALLGQDYLQDIAVENADGSALARPLKWTLTGALPEGLTMTEQSELVTVSGRARVAGIFNFGLGVEDANGRSESMDYTLVVQPPRYKVVAAELPDPVRPGQEVQVALTVSPAGAVSWHVVSGAMPPGLTLSDDGVITGAVTDEREGLWSFVVEAKDSRGMSGLGALGLRVEREPTKEGCSTTPGGLASLWLMLLGLFALRGRARARSGLMAAALVGALVPTVASAQNYQVVGPTPVTFQALGTGGLPAGQTVTRASSIPFPFDFPFYGRTYTSGVVSIYGYLALGSSSATSYSNVSIPHSNTSSQPAIFIAPWWDDMDDTNSSPVKFKYAVVGTAPNRTLIVEWNNTASFSSTSSRTSYQAYLWENGRIRFTYASTAPASSSASVGIQGALGQGVPGLTCASSANCSSALYPKSMAIDFYPPAELELASFSGPQTGYSGVSYPMTATVRNSGGRDADGVDVRFYVSTTPVWHATDAVIGTQSVASIASGASVQVTSDAPLPASLAQGNYYVFARVDPDGLIAENDETNNLSAGVPMTVGPPAPDLVVTNVSSATTASPGTTLSVTRSFQNRGNARSASVKYTYFLSDNDAVTVSDRALTPVGTLGELDAQAIDTGSDSVALPADLQAGAYWLGACVNYDAASGGYGEGEISIVNNCITGPQVRLSTSELSILTHDLPGATQYAPYGLRLEAAGGNGGFTWEVAAGSNLPTGLALSSAGDLSGSPSRTGSFSFDVKVTSGTLTQTGTLTLSVSSGELPLVVVDQTLPAAEFGRAYSAPLVAVGGKPPYRWMLNDGEALPAGLALSSDGTIEGRAAESGDFSFAVMVKDSTAAAASKQLTVRVVTPLALGIATSALEPAFVGREVLQPLVAVGGRAPYAWSLIRFQRLAENVTEAPGRAIESSPSGSAIDFPAELGLSIEDSAEVDYLRGVPRQAGLYVLTLRVTDGVGAQDTATMMLYVTYQDGLAITTTVLPDAFLGSMYSVRLSHNGGREAEGINFSTSCVLQAIRAGEFVCVGTEPTEALPSGLILSSDGAISGTPTGSAGIFSFLVKVSDARGRQDVRAVSIRVRAEEAPAESGCSGTGLEPSLLALLGAAAALRRRRAHR